MADERLTSYAKDKLVGLLKADDPGNEVATAWQAKEALRELYAISDPSLARRYADSLFLELTGADNPNSRCQGRWHSLGELLHLGKRRS
ncbi:unnamed protein product [Acidithrix sp. C25]|nr:unnamed protein product [Acidithrix sp. C25]